MYSTFHQTSGNPNPDICTAASQLYDIGLNIFPTRNGGKEPAISWKPLQHKRIDQSDVRYWWHCRDDLGIAILLGSISHDVCGRDFDSPESLKRWLNKHRKLAKELPIARSRRGGHVYFRSSESKTTELVDGEIRADGSYLIAPPSRHKSGVQYSWLNPFRSLPKFIDPKEEGLADQSLQKPPPIPLGNRQDADIVRCRDVPLEEAISQAIHQTLPSRFGQRHNRIFDFVRRLRGIPELRAKSGLNVLPYGEEWYRAALPFIATKDWKTSRERFLSAWDVVKFPKTDEVLKSCLAEVDSSSPSPIAIRYLRDPVAVRLIGLCERLQVIHGDEPFYLSTNAFPLFGLKFKNQLHRRIIQLVENGVLRRERIGNSYQKTASEYCFIPCYAGLAIP